MCLQKILGEEIAIHLNDAEIHPEFDTFWALFDLLGQQLPNRPAENFVQTKGYYLGANCSTPIYYSVS